MTSIAFYSVKDVRTLASLYFDKFPHFSVEDPYIVTAARMFHIGLMDVTPEQRKAGKRRNFELAYGRPLSEC